MPSNSHRVVQNNLTANGMIRPTWRVLPVDVIDELEDYSELFKGSNHPNIYQAALRDVKAQPEPVDLLLNARVKTKKKKPKAVVQTRPKEKGKAKASENKDPNIHDLTSSFRVSTVAEELELDHEVDPDVDADFDMFSDLSEMLNTETGEWEYVDEAPKVVRFTDKLSYAAMTKHSVAS